MPRGAPEAAQVSYDLALAAVLRCVAEVLGVAEWTLDADSDFRLLKGSGVDSAEIVGMLGARGVPGDLLVTCPRLGDAARRLSRHRAPIPGTRPANRSAGRYPASREQDALLRLARMLGAQVHAQAAYAVMLDDVDETRLLAALDQVGKRQPALRTGIHHRDRAWTQQLNPAPPRIEIDPTPVDTSAALARRARELLADTEFDHASGDGLARWWLLGRRRRALVLVADQLVVDRRSWHVVLRDLEAAYRRRGRMIPLPPGPGDYVAWQTASTSATDYEWQLRWWAERMIGYHAEPIAPPDSAVSGPVALASVTLPRGAVILLHQQLRARRRVTMWQLVTGVLGSRLGAWAGVGEVVVVHHSAHRIQALGAMAGLVETGIPYTVPVGAGAWELAGRVRVDRAASWGHRDAQLGHLMTRIGSRDLDAIALRQADVFRTPPVISAGAVIPVPVAPVRQRRTLTVALAPGPAGLTLEATFRSDRIPPTRMRALLDQIRDDLMVVAAGRLPW